MALVPICFLAYYKEVTYQTQAEAKARELDDGFSKLAASLCEHALKNAVVENRLVAVGHAFNMGVVLNNTSSEVCTVEVEVDASTFDVSPLKPRNLTLPTGLQTVYWNLSPKAVGEQTVLVTSGLENITLGFVVRDSHYIPSSVSGAASIMSAVLGPILTLPWWLEWWRRRRDVQRVPEHKIILPS